MTKKLAEHARLANLERSSLRYMQLDIGTYKSTLHRLDSKTRANIIELAAWAEKDALPWLWSELAIITSKKKVSPLKPYDAIRQGFRTSINERNNMPLKENFYVAQLTMLDSELLRRSKAIYQLAAHPAWFAEDAKIEILHGSITRFLHYAIILLDEGSRNLQRVTRYGSGANDSEHYFQVYKGAEQVIYGRFSGMTHDDDAPYVGTAILRTAIEIRLRRAFGIQCLIDQDSGNFRPVDLSSIFEAVKRHRDEIEFSVNFDDTMKIYRWSNFYLHGAWRDFPWVPGFALQYLRPLLSGVMVSPGAAWSINNGIKMPRKVWNEIRSELAPTVPDRLLIEIWIAIKSVFKRRRSAGRWLLNPAEENNAECIFLD